MTSEKKVKSSAFKARLGTMDKKNPKTMYLFASTYLNPTEEKENYKDDVLSLEKDLKLNVKNLLRTQETINPEFLLVTEVPVARISPDRKVHYMIQFYFKPKALQNRSFNDVSEDFSQSCSVICENFENTIEKHGFKCSKSKTTNYL